MVERTAEQQNKEKRNQNKWGQSQRPLGHYTHQHSNHRGLRRRERVGEKYWQRLQLKISLTQETGTQVQTVPNRRNPRRYTKRQIFIKLTKIKNKKQQGKSNKNKQGNLHKVIGWFSAETLQDRWDGRTYFKSWKGKKVQTRLRYPAKISFRFHGEINSFTDNFSGV